MTVQCTLCPRMCAIAEGGRGACRVRANVGGAIRPLTYAKPCTVAVDPVEKKPLYHFLPGSEVLSLATVGCNLRCRFCQNWEISQGGPEDVRTYDAAPQQMVELAIERGCRSIACTYTDPVVYYEYALDCAVRAREAGILSVLVTAAYINPEPWRRLCAFTDAANIDLKAISDQFYRDICGAELQPVLNALVIAKECGVMVEVTNLVIPGLNDSDDDLQKLARWVKENLGAETPLHFSRFFPQYRMTEREPTPSATLRKARAIAEGEGLHFVYLGNITAGGGENTVCPGCGELLIERMGYRVRTNGIDAGCCPQCRRPVYGIWE